MQRTSLPNMEASLLRTADVLDKKGEYAVADSLHMFIKTAQNNIQNVLNDVPGGFMLQNLNQTAYGLKQGLGGFPGSGASYWDANGGETARAVDPRNLMMFQGGMSAKDIEKFMIEQYQTQMQDPRWRNEQRKQLMRDLDVMKRNLQAPGLSASDKQSIQESIDVYSGMLAQLPNF